MERQIRSITDYLLYLGEHGENVVHAWGNIQALLLDAKLITEAEAKKIDHLIINHDYSKWSEAEFYQYVRHLSGATKTKSEFKRAVIHHKDNNLHHWESLKDYQGEDWKCYVIEMVCDWMAMGKYYGDNALDYYQRNKVKIELPNHYREFLEKVLDVIYKINLEREWNDLYQLYNYIITQGNKKITMTLDGSQDLSWTFYEKHNYTDEIVLLIAKDASFLSELFKNLFYEMEECILYLPSDLAFENNDFTNRDFKSIYQDAYEKVFHDDRIEWHCGNEPYDEANVMTIENQEDKFVIRFTKVSKSRGRGIRFCNNGGNQVPFQILFKRLFMNLQKYDPNLMQVSGQIKSLEGSQS